jgi:hypothetical protein
MDKPETKEEKLLKQLIEEVRTLSMKLDNMSSRISNGATLKHRKKEKVKEAVDRSVNFSYALGGLAIACSALLFSFSQTVAFILNNRGVPEKFYFYWGGSGLWLLSGCITILSGFIEGRYSDRIGTTRRFVLLGRKVEIVTYWKRDILSIFAFSFCVAGAILLALSFF